MWDIARMLMLGLALPDYLSAAIEWLLIGLVVYSVLRFLRGTRGERLFRGMVVVVLLATVVLGLLANLLQLERIKVLYPPFVLGMLFAAVVVFQPELRRALMQLGATPLFRRLTGEIGRVTDSVVESVAYLSKNKIGAIIAIERNTHLSGLIESGCKLDARVTAPLLNTIFWPGSALHDLGVIISQGRIAAAAVQFPLTESDLRDPSLGSRHRAALGLTEESDAVVVVVSEETRAISLVVGGRIERFLTPETLRARLRVLLSEEAPAEPEPVAEDVPRLGPQRDERSRADAGSRAAPDGEPGPGLAGSAPSPPRHKLRAAPED
jgi:diadenylate cyclase